MKIIVINDLKVILPKLFRMLSRNQKMLLLQNLDDQFVSDFTGEISVHNDCTKFDLKNGEGLKMSGLAKIVYEDLSMKFFGSFSFFGSSTEVFIVSNDTFKNTQEEREIRIAHLLCSRIAMLANPAQHDALRKESENKNSEMMRLLNRNKGPKEIEGDEYRIYREILAGGYIATCSMEMKKS